jgi:hypothetical protein
MLATAAILVAAAPAAADPLAETAAATAATAGALPAQATQEVGNALPAVGQTAGALPQPADSVQRAAEPVQRAAGAEAPTRRAVSDAVRTAASPADSGSRGSLPADAADVATRAVGEPSRLAPVAPPSTGEALDGALRSLGDGLRSLLPVDALAPVAGLLAGAGLADLAPARIALGGVPPNSGPVALGDGPRLPGALAVLGAHTQPPALAPPRLVAVGGPGLTSSRSASAQPPAAEAGGRPGSSSPRKAPAPAAGGAAAAAPGGLSFVPFMGLLVLAALAAPRLLRRLDTAAASLRPAPFLCALERPG